MNLQATAGVRWRARGMAASVVIAVMSALAFVPRVLSQDAEEPPAPPVSLATVPVPGPGDEVMRTLVRDRTAAVQLGKALFWDTRVGSDNHTACATCHFSAGADSRVKPSGQPAWRATPLLGRARPEPHADTARLPAHALRQPRAGRAGGARQQRRGGIAGRVHGRLRPGVAPRRAPTTCERRLRCRLARRHRLQPQRRQHAARRAAQCAVGVQPGLQLPQLLGRPRQQHLQRRRSVRPAQRRCAGLAARAGCAARVDARVAVGVADVAVGGTAAVGERNELPRPHLRRSGTQARRSCRSWPISRSIRATACSARSPGGGRATASWFGVRSRRSIGRRVTTSRCRRATWCNRRASRICRARVTAAGSLAPSAPTAPPTGGQLLALLRPGGPPVPGHAGLGPDAVRPFRRRALECAERGGKARPCDLQRPEGAVRSLPQRRRVHECVAHQRDRRGTARPARGCEQQRLPLRQRLLYRVLQARPPPGGSRCGEPRTTPRLLKWE